MELWVYHLNQIVICIFNYFFLYFKALPLFQIWLMTYLLMKRIMGKNYNFLYVLGLLAAICQ